MKYDNLGPEWDYETAKIQHDIKTTDSWIQGKIITKISFSIKNRKHVWRKTIEKMPNPIEPDKTVGESMSISKFKNHVTLYPKGQQKIVKDGVVRELQPEDCGNGRGEKII